MMMRADQLLVHKQLAQSRSQAAQLIKEGAVTLLVNGCQSPVAKPSAKLPLDTVLHVAESSANRFVSRGAIKLERALSRLPSIDSAIALDVGQSTGGFTDCLLANGAKHVVGVDVGRDQLAELLRQDSRVTCYEGVNARNLPNETLLAHSPGGFDIIVMDVSFISQTLILPGLPRLLKPSGWLVSLVKPQFEVGPDGIGKGGLVRDTALYDELQVKLTSLVASIGLSLADYEDSPITGGDGNREFLMTATKANTMRPLKGQNGT